MFSVTTQLRFIEPQLATAVDEPPQGHHWIHEIKHDGYRCQVLLERGQARVFTRNGYDWTDRYRFIARAASNLRCQSAIIDGEAIVQDETGASDFESLNSAMRWRPESIILYAFDLMHLDGKNLRQRALSDRRSILKVLLRSDEESRIQFSEEFVVTAPRSLRHVRTMDLRALSPNIGWHLIALAAPGHGSRPSASPNRTLS